MKFLITGTAGFIGFHLARLLLDEGNLVCGYDGITNYYDINLKKKRHQLLIKNSNFEATEGLLEDFKKLNYLAKKFQPDIIVHLAAQAGVRYSLENPNDYIQSNICGTFNVMEIARIQKVKHLLISSTSSVYGDNKLSPFKEEHKADQQLTIYSATKKANESMAHAYSHLWKIPTTIVRLFTVYGPWGRPDMALFKFVESILNDRPIDIYNYGEMFRDFTYIDDVVTCIKLLSNCFPNISGSSDFSKKKNLSFNAPYRVVNIGNSSKVKLIDFVETIEKVIGKKAIKNFMPMQKGDVHSTFSDTSLLSSLIGFTPKTKFEDGITEFVKWYRKYYKI
jgi:UDP-glucuronate 4-epimerase